MIARPYFRSLPLIITLGLLSTLLEGLGISLLIPLLTMLAGVDLTVTSVGLFSSLTRLLADFQPQMRVALVGGGMVLLFLCKGVLATMRETLETRVEEGFNHDMRVGLARSVLGADYRLLLQEDDVHLLNVISSEVWRVSSGIRACLSLVTAAVALTIFALLLMILSWQLTLMVLVAAAAVAIWVRGRHKRMRLLGKAVQETNERLGGHMLTIIQSARMIRLFGAEEVERGKFSEASDLVGQAMRAVRRLGATIVPQIEVALAILFVAILLAGGFLGVAVVTTVTFLVLLSRAQPQFQALGQGWLGMVTVADAAEEVERVLRLSPDGRVLSTGDLPRVKLDRPIVFEQVSFNYPDGSRALENVDLVIPDRSITALIGPSGAGKSTLVNLVSRLVEPDAGVILLGERNVGEFDLAGWRASIAVAGQDLDLIPGTLLDNIRYGRPSATLAEVQQALQDARAAAFVKSLPQGLETVIGQAGAGLSGGQKQRIGLARALLAEPDLLILDEAMNAVDGLTEDEVIAILSERRHFRTCLVISHRKSTLSMCDHGIVLIDGHCTSTGNLSELNYYTNMAGLAAV